MVVPAASPVLLLWMLATDVDTAGPFVIALRLLAVVGRLSVAGSTSTSATATATAVLIVALMMMMIAIVVVVVVIVVVVVVRAEVAILLLMMVARLGGIVVTRTEYRRRMFELLSVSIGTTVSPVLLWWNRHGAGSDGRRSTLLLDYIQQFLLLLLGLY